LSKFNDILISSYVSVRLFTRSKQSCFLEGRLLSSQSEQFEKFSKSSDWLEKSDPPKKPLLLWSCKQSIHAWAETVLIIQLQNQNYFLGVYCKTADLCHYILQYITLQIICFY